MASSAEYLDYVLEQLSGLEDVSYRPVMGEYIIYYKGKIIGGIYDDRVLVTPVESAKRLMPDAEFISPYPGAGELLAVDIIDDREALKELLHAMYDELPASKKRR